MGAYNTRGHRKPPGPIRKTKPRTKPKQPDYRRPKAELAERRRKIAEMITLMFRHSEIVAKVSEEFGVSERQAYRDLDIVYADLEADHERAKPKRAQHVRQALEALLKRCVANNQLSAAVQVIDRLCRIDGLYAPEEVNLSGSLEHDHDHKHAHLVASTGDIRNELQQLMALRQQMLTAGKNGKAKGKNGANGSVH